MKLPGGDQAFIPRAKLTNYLLSDVHPVGRSKARFFASLGFDVGGADSLECLLRRIGIDDSEFVGGAGAAQRVHIYQGQDPDGDVTGGGLGAGPSMTGSTASDTTLSAIISRRCWQSTRATTRSSPSPGTRIQSSAPAPAGASDGSIRHAERSRHAAQSSQ